MKVFTITNGIVERGAIVDTLQIKEANVKIPAIIIGESGRGRLLGVLPVQLTGNQLREWREKGRTRILYAVVGKTMTGRPKLFSLEEDEISQNAICVFRTHMGFRGGNSHTGDRKSVAEEEPVEFLPFPGQILVRGVIAEGIAGRKASGDQLIAVIPPSIFRTGYSGRLYGQPSAHYYKWDGQVMLGGLTWEERLYSELF